MRRKESRARGTKEKFSKSNRKESRTTGTQEKVVKVREKEPSETGTQKQIARLGLEDTKTTETKELDKTRFEESKGNGTQEQSVTLQQENLKATKTETLLAVTKLEESKESGRQEKHVIWRQEDEKATEIKELAKTRLEESNATGTQEKLDILRREDPKFTETKELAESNLEVSKITGTGQQLHRLRTNGTQEPPRLSRSHGSARLRREESRVTLIQAANRRAEIRMMNSFTSIVMATCFVLGSLSFSHALLPLSFVQNILFKCLVMIWWLLLYTLVPLITYLYLLRVYYQKELECSFQQAVRIFFNLPEILQSGRNEEAFDNILEVAVRNSSVYVADERDNSPYSTRTVELWHLCQRNFDEMIQYLQRRADRLHGHSERRGRVSSIQMLRRNESRRNLRVLAEDSTIEIGRNVNNSFSVRNGTDYWEPIAMVIRVHLRLFEKLCSAFGLRNWEGTIDRCVSYLQMRWRERLLRSPDSAITA